MRAVARSWSEIAGDAWGMRCDCWSQWRSRSSKQIIAGHNVEQLLHSSVLSSLRSISMCATRAWSSEMDGRQFSDIFNFSPTYCSASLRPALQTSMGQISDSSWPIACAHSLRKCNAANPVTPRGTPKLIKCAHSLRKCNAANPVTLRGTSKPITCAHSLFNGALTTLRGL